MFGLSQLEERAIWAGVVILVIVGFAWHERSLGAAKCERADTQVTAAQEAHNATVEAQGTTTVFQEASEYHAAVSTPIDHPVSVRVCNAPSGGSLPNTTSTGSVRHDSAPLSGPGDTAPVPRELGPELQAAGRDADAQIAELQDYVTKVCRVR